MSIDEEKTYVRSLRASGMTISEIAQKVGKSSHWVYSRINDKYAPKRKRETAEIPPEAIGEMPNSADLLTELETVRALRASGLTYEAIANQLGRSVYWVHSRLRGKYRPHDLRTERRFQDEAVVPFLVGGGHDIVAECSRIQYGEFVLEADIQSRLDDKLWVTEVKVSARGHQLHTAIGQLMLHRALHPLGTDLRLQVVFPESARLARIDGDVLDRLHASTGISVVFLPWAENP